MDDRLRETLSAMMDDEADELAVRRLLSCSDQDEVRGQWQRWQQIHDLMHGAGTAADSVSPAADVSAGVWQRLDGKVPAPEHHTAKATGGQRWHWPAVAMITLALVVGFGAGSGWQSAGEIELVAVQTAAESNATAMAASVSEVSLQGLDDRQRQQIHRYLLEHAQHNSVGAGRGSVGYARLVSADAGGY
ncbi:MAG TPA: sigma-E factor negative regulatory protein [Marinobacter sp.]|nr:sigma-E factor negative regulatory protein [Marinobacter sp.]